MWFLRRKSAGGPVAGATATRRPKSTALGRLALACLALAAPGLGGCQSNGCNSCGNGGGGLAGVGSSITSGLNRMGRGMQNTAGRLFNCKRCKGAGGDCCGGAVIEGTPIVGTPVVGGTVIEGPPSAIESYPNKMVPGGPPAAPYQDSTEPKILEPAPPGGPARKTGSAVDPRASRSRPVQSASISPRSRTIESGVQGREIEVARAGAGDNRRSTAASLLDTLPLVDLPEQVARRNAGPIPPEADLVKPAKPAATAPASALQPVATLSLAREPELPAIKAGVDTSTTPGIKRFVSVNPKVSGGSMPSSAGLDWLKENGIRTLVDLRVSKEVDAAFVEAVKARGFRYVALEIDAEKPEPGKVGKFHDELGKTDGQPVFFFDGDGRRAGLIWYVHGLTYKTLDLATANRDATELGLTDKATWLAAASYLDAARKPSVAEKPALPTLSSPSARNSADDATLTKLASPLASWTRPGFSAGSAANPSEMAR